MYRYTALHDEFKLENYTILCTNYVSRYKPIIQNCYLLLFFYDFLGDLPLFIGSSIVQ